MEHLRAATRTPKRIITFFKKQNENVVVEEIGSFFIVNVEDQNKCSIPFCITSSFKRKL